MNSPIDEMRSIIGIKSPVHAKHMSDHEILSWFTNIVSWVLESKERAFSIDRPHCERIINCWADYCLLQEVQSVHETKGNHR